MVEDVETFKAQLVQSFELSDNLIAELQKKEQEISTFKAVKENLQHVVEEQKNQISQLKNVIDEERRDQLRKQVDSLASQWLRTYGLEEDKRPDVTRMLMKFAEDDELGVVEEMLGLEKGSVQSRAVSITEPSSNLVETFSNESSERSMEDLSPFEKIDMLHNELKSMNKQKNR